MSFLPSLLHDELLRQRGREGRRRAAGAPRPVRPSLPPAAGAARRAHEDDGGGRRGTAPAAVPDAVR
jgi:hypothetical protein